VPACSPPWGHSGGEGFSLGQTTGLRLSSGDGKPAARDYLVSFRGDLTHRSYRGDISLRYIHTISEGR
jgi:hypothetical protein